MSESSLYAQLERASSGVLSIGVRRSDLPPDVEQDMSRRLSIAALCVAVMAICIFTLPRLSVLIGSPELFNESSRLTVDIICGLLCMDGLGTWTISRRGILKGGQLIRVAALYKVAVGLGISVIATVSPLSPETKLYGIPPVVAWLMLFPTIVPLPFKLATVSTLLTAATAPLVLVLFHHWGWTDPSPAAYTQIIISCVIGAGMSLIPAHVIRQLGHSVSEARVLGSYRLERLLGRGGMGEVWVASHRLLARPAAIKLIKPSAMATHGTDGSTPKMRFEREAQATASLRSPHTVEIYDYGVTEDGTFYYAMELLEGVNLEALVERFGPVSPARAIRMLRQMADALAEAHQRGLIHRDIKPANAIVTPVGLACDLVKVLDFGLVRLRSGFEQVQKNVELTGEGVVAGTPAWIAPEVALGVGEIDGRADMYALGCVGYWLLSGQQVFTGKTPMEVILHHIRTPPPRLVDLCETPPPATLCALLARCLEKDPSDRYPDMVAVGRALDEIEQALPARWERDAAYKWWQAHLPEHLGTVGQSSP